MRCLIFSFSQQAFESQNDLRVNFLSSHLPSFYFAQNLVSFVFVKIKSRSVWILVSWLSILYALPHLAPVSSSHMQSRRYKLWEADALCSASFHAASFPGPFRFLVQSFRLSTRPTEASFLTAPIHSPAVKAAVPLQPRKQARDGTEPSMSPELQLRSECWSGLRVSRGRLAFSAFSKPLAFLFSEASQSCPPHPFSSVCLNKPYLAALWRRYRNRNRDWTVR